MVCGHVMAENGIEAGEDETESEKGDDGELVRVEVVKDRAKGISGANVHVVGSRNAGMEMSSLVDEGKDVLGRVKGGIGVVSGAERSGGDVSGDST